MRWSRVAFRIGILSLMVAVCWSIAPSVFAVNPAPVSYPVAQAAPLAALQDVSLASLGLPDQTVRGIHAGADLYFPGPGQQQLIEGSLARLIFSYSSIVLPDRSTVSITLNNVPIASFRLTAADSRRTAVEVPIPASAIRPQSNRLRFQFYMRIVDDSCRDFDNPALTATISNETALVYNLGTELVNGPAPDLANFPAPFLRSDPLPSRVNFVIPSVPSAADYGAMASIAAKLGQGAGTRPITTTVSFATNVPADIRNDNLILIGTPPANPLIADIPTLSFKPSSAGFTGVDGAVPAEQGVIQIAPSPYNPLKTVLVVSGGNEEGVRRAGVVLASTTLRRVVSGAATIVTTPPVAPESPFGRENGRIFTLADLGYDDLTSTGPGAKPLEVRFDAPLLQDRNGGSIDLSMSHSTPLAEGSVLNVVLNGTPIATVPLNDGNAARNVVRVPMPPTTISPGQNILQLGYLLQRDRQDCSALPTDSGWGVIHQDTQITLPYASTGSQFGLQYYPFPFVTNGNTTDTVLVMPEQPVARDVNTAIQLAADLGRRTRADTTTIDAMPSSGLNNEIRHRKNLIVIGLPSSQPFLEQINKDLPLQFNGTELVLRNANSTAMQVRAQGQVGVLQIIPSPFSGSGADQRAILVVSGTTQDGLESTLTALRSGGMSGLITTLTRDGQVSTYDSDPQSPFAVALPDRRNYTPLIASAVIGVLILVLVIGMAVQTFRERRRHALGRYDSAPSSA